MGKNIPQSVAGKNDKIILVKLQRDIGNKWRGDQPRGSSLSIFEIFVHIVTTAAPPITPSVSIIIHNFDG